jgi:hypothetical protein
MRLVPLLLLLASTLSASVGPEFPISAPVTAEAALAQIVPAVASNGADYFALWTDHRSSRDIRLYGARVHAGGSFASPFGFPIAENVYRAAVASTGRGYLVIYSQYGGDTYSLRFDDEGQAVSGPIRVGTGFIYSVVSNGEGFLALMSNAGTYEFSAVFFDEDGQARGGFELGLMNDPSLVAVGADYYIADERWSCDGVNPCRVQIRLTSIDNSTRQYMQKLVGLEVTQWARVSAIAAGDRIFMAVLADGPEQVLVRKLTVMAVSTDGSIAVAPRVIASLPAPCVCGTSRPSLAWDGREILVGWPARRSESAPDSEARVVGVRLDRDGSQLDAQPFAVTQFVSEAFVAASGRAGVLILSSEQRKPYEPYFHGPADLFSRGATSLAQIREAGNESVIQSAAAQDDAQVAARESRAIVVWREYDQPSAIRAAAMDITRSRVLREVTIAERASVPRTGAAVALLGNVALVTWRDEGRDGVRIFGRRVDLDGVPLDAQPILIAHIPESFPSPGTTSVATDGTAFLVVWNTEQDVLAARVLPDGQVSGGLIRVSRDADAYHRRIHPRVAWTGSLFLVVWSDDVTSHLITSPPPPPRTIIRAARVTAAGTVLDTAETPRLMDALGDVAVAAVAANGSRAMVVWSPAGSGGFSSSRCIQAMPLDSDGRALSEPKTVECEAVDYSKQRGFGPSVVPRNDGFIVFWSGEQTHDVRGRLLSGGGESGDSIVVSAPSHDAWNAAAATSALGMVVAYSRVGEEPHYGNAPRLFARVIDQAPPRRNRGVRTR